MNLKEVSYSKIVALFRKEINEVRMNPISLSGYLNSKKARFDLQDPLLFYPLKRAKQLCIKTKQGFKAVQQLDKYLLKQSACQELKWSYQLHLIAHKKAAKLARIQTYISTEDVSDETFQIGGANKFISSYPEQNIQKNPEIIQQMKYELKQGVQCILDNQYYLVYYGIIDPKEFISTLLIDDGFPNRQHRKALLNKRMNHIGIGIHEHPSQYFVIVIILANHVKQIIKQNMIDDTQCDCKVI